MSDVIHMNLNFLQDDIGAMFDIIGNYYIEQERELVNLDDTLILSPQYPSNDTWTVNENVEGIADSEQHEHESILITILSDYLDISSDIVPDGTSPPREF